MTLNLKDLDLTPLKKATISKAGQPEPKFKAMVMNEETWQILKQKDVFCDETTYKPYRNYNGIPVAITSAFKFGEVVLIDKED